MWVLFCLSIMQRTLKLESLLKKASFSFVILNFNREMNSESHDKKSAQYENDTCYLLFCIAGNMALYPFFDGKRKSSCHTRYYRYSVFVH